MVPKIVNVKVVNEDKNIIYLQLSFYTRYYTNKKNYAYVILRKIHIFFIFLYTKRFLKIPMNKFSNFVVCYRKYQELTFYISFRSLEPFFRQKISFFDIFFGYFGLFLHTKIEIFQNSQKPIISFCSMLYRRHIELTFYIGLRPQESLF